MSDEERKKRGPRLPFGQLGGIWTELAQTLRGLKDGTIVDVEQAKARCYVLNTMLGVVDRLQEQRALDTMQAEVAAVRSELAAGKVVATTATRPALPASTALARSADA